MKTYDKLHIHAHNHLTRHCRMHSNRIRLVLAMKIRRKLLKIRKLIVNSRKSLNMIRTTLHDMHHVISAPVSIDLHLQRC